MRKSRGRLRRFLRISWRILLTAIACLLVVLAFKTWRLESRQIQVPMADRIELPEQEIVDRFASALAIKTISEANPARVDPAAFDQFKRFLEASFPLVHQRLSRMTGVDFGNERNQSLLFKWQGSEPENGNAILLMAHYDVVPVEAASLEDWIHPPFGGESDDQYVWGRGAIDNKGAAMGIMEAVEYLLGQGFQPSRTIYLSLGHDEELGGIQGNKQIAEWMKQRGIRLEYVLDEGGGIFNEFAGLNVPAAFIGIGEKGFATIKLDAQVSEAGHASMPPPLPDTALGLLGEALHRLHRAPHPASMNGGLSETLDYVGPEMSLFNRVAVANRWLFSPLLVKQLGSTPLGNATLRTTIAPTIVEGGIKDNVLPTRASMTLNIRVIPGDTVESAREHIKEIIKTIPDSRVTVGKPSLQREPSRLSSTESDAFGLLHRTIREIYPTVVVAPFVVIAGTDAIHYDAPFASDSPPDPPLAENVYRFVPWRLGKEDLKQIHGVNERLSRTDYIDLVRFYERLIRNTASSSRPAQGISN